MQDGRTRLQARRAVGVARQFHPEIKLKPNQVSSRNMFVLHIS